VRAGLGERSVWLVAAFIFLFNFSPSFGPAFMYYQTDVLGFSQQYIGASTRSRGQRHSAFIYARCRACLRRVMNLRLACRCGYPRLPVSSRAGSALAIHFVWGVTGMLTTLAS
jgi:hypothetical protein